MHLVSDFALAVVATAISADCNGAFALLSGVAAGQFVYRWWRRNSSPRAAHAAPATSPRSAAHQRRSGELRAAIARLPAEQQRVVHLRFIDGCDLHEVSARTGLTYDEIKSVQYRALTALAGRLDNEAEAPTTPSPPL